MGAIYRTNNPLEFDDVDGVIVDETAPAPSIQGAPANIAALVAQFQRGDALLNDVGSIGEFHEKYGKANFGGNTALKNKKFGRLKVVRVIASDAVLATDTIGNGGQASILRFDAKQGKGVYGNEIEIKVEDGSSSRLAAWLLTCVSGAALHEKYFILEDAAGTVAFWFDVGGGGVEPAHGADRSVEITTVGSGDANTVVTTKVITAVNADSEFVAVAGLTTTTVVVTAVDREDMSTASAGNSGFTVALTQAGVYAGKKYTIKDTNDGAVLPEESYDDVSTALIGTELPFAGSSLVDVTVLNGGDDGDPDNQAFTALASGADGTVANSDYQAALVALEVERACNVVFLDEYNATRNGYLKTHIAATTDKMAIMAGPEVETEAEAVTAASGLRDTAGALIYAFPWVKTTIDGESTFTSPAAWVASIFSQTAPHISIGEKQAVPNMMAGATGLKRSISRAGFITLKEGGVCAFEQDQDIGITIKSAITTQIANSSKLTILRRRMANYLIDSMGTFLKLYQDAPNSEDKRGEVGGAFQTFIQNNENEGILPKDSEVKTGKAKLVDTESLNTDATIAAGFFKILYKQRIFSSMRFIVLQAEIGESVVVTEQE